MQTLIDTTLARTLDSWTDELLRDAQPAMQIEGWLFEDRTARHIAEERLAAAGLRVRLRSAYKPLVHHFMEEVELDGLAVATVLYPVHPAASAQRFALEAYPLADMLPGVDLRLQAQPVRDATPCYRVDLRWRDGRRRVDEVFAPNRVHRDLQDNEQLSPCAWLRTANGVDAARSCDFEDVFELAMKTLQTYA